jgi:hypothetical protein
LLLALVAQALMPTIVAILRLQVETALCRELCLLVVVLAEVS